MLSSINALSRLEWQPSCWFNWWLYILSNDTCQKALQTCPQFSLTAPNVLNIWWIVKPLTSTNLHDLSPLFTKTKPKPNIKNQTNLTFNLVFPPPPPYFLPKKNLPAPGSHSCNHPLQRHVLQPRSRPKVRCHEDEVSPGCFQQQRVLYHLQLVPTYESCMSCIWVKMGKYQSWEQIWGTPTANNGKYTYVE